MPAGAGIRLPAEREVSAVRHQDPVAVPQAAGPAAVVLARHRPRHPARSRGAGAAGAGLPGRRGRADHRGQQERRHLHPQEMGGVADGGLGGRIVAGVAFAAADGHCPPHRRHALVPVKRRRQQHLGSQLRGRIADRPGRDSRGGQGRADPAGGEHRRQQPVADPAGHPARRLPGRPGEVRDVDAGRVSAGRRADHHGAVTGHRAGRDLPVSAPPQAAQPRHHAQARSSVPCRGPAALSPHLAPRPRRRDRRADAGSSGNRNRNRNAGGW